MLKCTTGQCSSMPKPILLSARSTLQPECHLLTSKKSTPQHGACLLPRKGVHAQMNYTSVFLNTGDVALSSRYTTTRVPPINDVNKEYAPDRCMSTSEKGVYAQIHYTSVQCFSISEMLLPARSSLQPECHLITSSSSYQLVKASRLTKGRLIWRARVHSQHRHYQGFHEKRRSSSSGSLFRLAI